MKLRSGIWSFDSRDLLRSKCQHCTLLAVGRELQLPGLAELLAQFYERPQSLAIDYGIRFEEALEHELKQNLGDLVAKPENQTLAETIELMEQGIPIIYQGVLQGGSGSIAFSGRPDFLLRSDWRFEFGRNGLSAKQVDGWRGGYSAWDAKLSKEPKIEYQNQVGLYVDALHQLGLLGESQSGLLLGSRELADFGPSVLRAQMIERRDVFMKDVFEFIESDPQRLEEIGELICETTTACKICEYPNLCEHQRRETNHLQLVFGITGPQIQNLKNVGIKNVKQLAESEQDVPKISPETLKRLRHQAGLQQQMYESGQPLLEIIEPKPLVELPPESKGDIFFDLEGFTFFEEPGGLEYLFGYVSIEDGERFHHSWADTRETEKLAFEKFMIDVLARLERYPDARIYHYANYEQAALMRLAERFESYRDELADLLARGVFVDLFKVVKASLILSQESYSIKKLENYYSFDRVSDVKEAMGSMEYYDQYLKARDTDPSAAENLKRQVLDYNQDDCISTLALVRWLRSLVDGDV